LNFREGATGTWSDIIVLGYCIGMKAKERLKSSRHKTTVQIQWHSFLLSNLNHYCVNRQFWKLFSVFLFSISISIKDALVFFLILHTLDLFNIFIQACTHARNNVQKIHQMNESCTHSLDHDFYTCKEMSVGSVGWSRVPVTRSTLESEFRARTCQCRA